MARIQQVFTDGSVRLHDLHAGCAFALFSRHDGYWHGKSIPLGRSSSHDAERHAIFAALDACLALRSTVDKFVLLSDCATAISSVAAFRAGEVVSGERLGQNILDKIRLLEKSKKEVVLQQIPGHNEYYLYEGNRVADRWAKIGSRNSAPGGSGVEELHLHPGKKYKWEDVWGEELEAPTSD